ncbi:MAG: hypothetical protein OEY01_10830 [Desulfobulbaceae bacterium]|nr:hypothetical protein [Desulfobulbaceae bacterium]
MIDEVLRSGYGFLVCWPMVALCSKWRLKALPTALLLAIYMVPVWRLYRVLERTICG